MRKRHAAVGVLTAVGLAGGGLALAPAAHADYGPDTCVQGYDVWREAVPGDHVCVSPTTATQVAADNAQAASRWTSGPYGPHTCVRGYVWRGAVQRR